MIKPSRPAAWSNRLWKRPSLVHAGSDLRVGLVGRCSCITNWASRMPSAPPALQQHQDHPGVSEGKESRPGTKTGLAQKRS